MSWLHALPYIVRPGNTGENGGVGTWQPGTLGYDTVIGARGALAIGAGRGAATIGRGAATIGGGIDGVIKIA